ncbi:MAG: hypothetical protein KJ718_06460 [Nanoarchaeota archaeon]|nr:hypothetical protein [Nanoarchaeota archaeon]MBU1052160.1 hypothetical protein [Nanoarchaeota archaeon]MBU1987976.1 hypothetical protein [Nanoarchaeota archaeon]
MNNRGQVPTIILVVAALVLAVLALFVIITFQDNENFQSKDISRMLSDLEFSQQYITIQTKFIFQETLSSCPTCPPKQLKQKIKDSVKEIPVPHYVGNLFLQLRTGKFTLTEENSQYQLEIQDLFVQSEKGVNKIVRNFNICLIFDSRGNFLRNC